MHLELRYVTRFVYPLPVWDSHNALRAKPAMIPHQTVGSYAVHITPWARVFTYTDNWGTEVNTFSIVEPHEELVVEATASVDTHDRPAPPRGIPPTALSADAFRESHWTFLQPSRHVSWNSEIRSVATEVITSDGDVVGRVERISAFVSDRLEYKRGATVVGTSLPEVWDQGAGVCQDFSHLTVGLLRSVGIPARYVSGYLYAADPSDHELRDDGEVVVQTHAWVEAAIPGWGWWGVDPTNATIVGDRHVTIGHGRDYEDVMPMRGVYHGDSEAELGVEVTMGPTVISRTALPEFPVDQ